MSRYLKFSIVVNQPDPDARWTAAEAVEEVAGALASRLDVGRTPTLRIGGWVLDILPDTVKFEEVGVRAEHLRLGDVIPQWGVVEELRLVWEDIGTFVHVGLAADDGEWRNLEFPAGEWLPVVRS